MLLMCSLIRTFISIAIDAETHEILVCQKEDVRPEADRV